jgi:tRNA(fMet)-specific endonuclease VapC
MLQFRFDTDHLTLYRHAHPLLMQRYAAQPQGTVGVSAVTVEEAFRGRLAQISQARKGAQRVHAYQLLVATLRLFDPLVIVEYDVASEVRFQHLRSLHLRTGSQDLKIASVALANNLILLTRNKRDFAQVPGLVIDDWTV